MFMVNWKMVAEGECLSTASRYQAGFLPGVCVWEQKAGMPSLQLRAVRLLWFSLLFYSPS